MANTKPPAGYDARFLGVEVPAPMPVDDADAPILDYTHFSVTMHRQRRLAWSVAWAIDGLRLFPDIPRHRDFFADDRLPLDEQTTDEVYAANDLDRGHLARRADLLWGTLAEARAANRDSFCFTNITPQHADFNQSGRGGAWGELEHAVLDLDGLHERRVVVFAGPVLAADDPEYRDVVRLPRQHWKVVVYRLGDAVSAPARSCSLRTSPTCSPPSSTGSRRMRSASTTSPRARASTCRTSPSARARAVARRRRRRRAPWRASTTSTGEAERRSRRRLAFHDGRQG